jgi:Reverse transcriptase (RNA-dependent DNA polymerase)
MAANMLNSLLQSGFLPKELPPLFSSKTLGILVDSINLPAVLTAEKANWTQPTHHNLCRPGGLRRRLTLPNPVNFYRLAKAFADNSAELSTAWSGSPFSKTTPNFSNSGVRAIATEITDRATPRVSTRVGARYLLRADISQFYPSIYSHSIPWALHTKEIAKAKMRDASLLGNKIDKEIQASQYGQTKGIAIGPDTSLGIAELLLTPLDIALKRDCKILRGVRFIDDIELTFSKLSDAEKALARLESLLNDLELQLHATKTRVVELPDQIESLYVTTLRPFIPKVNNAPASQWIDYFNRAFLAARADPQDGVLRYAIAALQSVHVTPKTWPLVQELLWQCISSDPGCIRFVIDVLLINKHSHSNEPDCAVASIAVNALILSSASVGHGSEVLWAIWSAMVLDIKISMKSQQVIALVDDAFVAIAALIAKDKGIFNDDFDSPLWASWVVNEAFDQDHWIFVYEAYFQGWFSNEVKAAKLKTVLTLKFFKANAITFIDEDAPQTYRPARLQRQTRTYSAGGGY